MVEFYIQDNTQESGWFDMTQWWAFESLQHDENDVDGPNAGRALSALMIRDKIGEKEKFFFDSIYMPIEVAWHIKSLVRREYYTVRTNLRDGVLRDFIVYSGNRTMDYKIAYADGSEMVKLKFNMIER